MDYIITMVQRKFLTILKTNEKSKNSENREGSPTKIGLHAFHVKLYLHVFFEPILFFDPHGLSVVQRENLAILKAKNKQAKSRKLERLHPPKFVCMHFTSTSTCMNFLRQFYFLTPMDCPWFEGKIWPF